MGGFGENVRFLMWMRLEVKY